MVLIGKALKRKREQHLLADNDILPGRLVPVHGQSEDAPNLYLMDDKTSGSVPAKVRPPSRMTRNPADPSTLPDVTEVHTVVCGLSARRADHSKHIPSATYYDVPGLFEGDNKVSQLRGGHPVTKIPERASNIVVTFSYQCEDFLTQHDGSFKSLTTANVPDSVRAHLYSLPEDIYATQPTSIKVHLESKEMSQELSTVFQLYSKDFKPWNSARNLTFPFPFYFHHGTTLRSPLEEYHVAETRAFGLALLRCIEQLAKENYNEARALFAAGKVNKQHFEKLFTPEEIVISKVAGEMQAYWVDGIEESADEVTLACWSYGFDGVLSKDRSNLHVQAPAEGELVAISDLAVCPLRLAGEKIKRTLLKRGRKCWSCRNKRFVRYSAPRLPFQSQTAQPRYMIDYVTYRALHDQDSAEVRTEGVPQPSGISFEDAEANEMAKNSDFFLLLPPFVKGYGFLDKKWCTISVRYIRKVKWNDTAFEKGLVLDEKKKDIIKTLIKAHVTTSKGVDLIEGKGNGLIMLLHGSPGTGKTLTAESVAELAMKPLYRVTCGDMGVEPQAVEDYLSSVLHIGAAWDCVVLLDEADVFLEKRTTEDITRNSLVSVFLRALEYYDGILILTTNRIGLFDEAFKSRIQLAVAFPKLNTIDRKMIWHDIIVDISEADRRRSFDRKALIHRLNDLARPELNGRQIRNVVQCALRLADEKDEALSYAHFQALIGLTEEFDHYVARTRPGGLTDDEMAEATGLRVNVSKED